MQHTLTCESTFGNFKWTATVDVSDDQAVKLADAGLLQILQRSPASKAEKSLAGYEKRPKNFERKDIPFNDDNAKALSEFLGAPVEIGLDGDKKPILITPTVSVKYHEIGATKELVYAKEKEIVTKHIDAKDIATWAVDKIGYTGGGDLDVNNVELLKAVKAFKDALIAKEL